LSTLNAGATNDTDIVAAINEAHVRMTFDNTPAVTHRWMTEAYGGDDSHILGTFTSDIHRKRGLT
jgi:hypothetical protein